MAAVFERTDEQQAIIEMVRQFVDEQIIPQAEHYDAADEFPAPISNAGKRWAAFANWIAAAAMAPAGIASHWPLTSAAEAREKISPRLRELGSRMPVGPEASTPMARARRAVIRRNGGTGQLNMRKWSSIC